MRSRTLRGGLGNRAGLLARAIIERAAIARRAWRRAGTNRRHSHIDRLARDASLVPRVALVAGRDRSLEPESLHSADRSKTPEPVVGGVGVVGERSREHRRSLVIGRRPRAEVGGRRLVQGREGNRRDQVGDVPDPAAGLDRCRSSDEDRSCGSGARASDRRTRPVGARAWRTAGAARRRSHVGRAGTRRRMILRIDRRGTLERRVDRRR